MDQTQGWVSETDVAYQILQQAGKALYFRDLISRVVEEQARQGRMLASKMAEIHTQINMDSRFTYRGKGLWGLSEWQPRRGRISHEETSESLDEGHLRREKLLEDIQQDFIAATLDSRD